MIKYRIITQAVHHQQKPQRTRVTVNDVKMRIAHAQNLCANYENTHECKHAWETVNELTEELDRQREEHLIKISSPK